MYYKLAIIGILFFLISCGKNTKESSIVSEKEEISIENPTVAITDLGIPSYSFEEFENQFLASPPEGVLVLNFWATWCKPCVKELPAFEQLGAHYREQGVRVVLVSLDFPEHVEKAVIPFMEKHGIKNEVVLLDDPDANSWIPKVSNDWSGAIPATLIIANEQRFFYEQSFTYETLENTIQPLLNNKS